MSILESLGMDFVNDIKVRGGQRVLRGKLMTYSTFLGKDVARAVRRHKRRLARKLREELVEAVVQELIKLPSVLAREERARKTALIPIIKLPKVGKPKVGNNVICVGGMK